MDKTRLLRVIRKVRANFLLIILILTSWQLAQAQAVPEEIMNEVSGWIENFQLDDELLQELTQIQERFNNPVVQEHIRNIMRDLSGEMDVYHPEVEFENTSETGGYAITIFISGSIPFSTLKNYIEVADKNTRFVLRGPVGPDPSKIMPTVDFVTQLLCGRPYAQLNDKTSCKEVPIDIDPLIFREYGVSRVPTIAVHRGKDVYLLTGAMPVTYVLDQIRR